MTTFSKFFVHGQVLISLCTPLLFLMFALKGKQNFSLLSPFFLFFGTFTAYSFLRIFPSYKEENPSASAELYLRHRWFYILPIIVSLVLAGNEIYRAERLWPLLSSFLVVLFYEYKKLKVGLRQIPLLKTFMVAFVWANLCCALFPILNWVHYADCFIFIFLLTLIFDFKDLKQDSEDNILTIVRLLGADGFVFCMSITYTLYCAFIALAFQEYTFFASVLVVYYALYKRDVSTINFHILVDGLIILRSLLYLAQY